MAQAEQAGRLRTVRGWVLIVAFYLLLLGVSGVAFLAPSLATREGRWGVGLALANLTLVFLGTGVTWFAYRRGERWAWWLVFATGAGYGLPMTLIDHLQVGWMGPVSVLEFSLLGLWAAGLLLGARPILRIGRPDALRKLLALLATQVGSLVNLSEWAAMRSFVGAYRPRALLMVQGGAAQRQRHGKTEVRRLPAQEVATALREHLPDPPPG